MRNLLHIAPLFFLVGQFGFDFGDSGTGSPGFLQAQIAAIAAALQYVWSVLVAAFNYLFAVLQFIWKFLLTVLQDIKKGFGWLWDSVVKAGLTKLVGTFLKVRQWLSNLLSPVIRFIKQLRAWYDAYFNQFVKPVLKIIRQMRQVLQVFRLLGFKWAARLDADLARIENKIVTAYITLRQYLNIATSWIQLVVDPLGILRRNPLFAALIRSAPELRNMMDAVTQRPLTSAEAAAQHKDGQWLSPSTRAQNMTFYKQGKLPPDVEAFRQQFIATKVDTEGNANG